MLSVKERFAAKKAQKQQQQIARLLKPATLSRRQINRANAQKISISKMQQQYREQMRNLDGRILHQRRSRCRIPFVYPEMERTRVLPQLLRAPGRV